MNISEVLSGRAGLAGVQWVLRAPSVRKILQGELSALLAAPVSLGRCHLRRAKFKPNRKLTAYYDVQLQGPGGRSLRPVAVTWTSPGADTWSRPNADLLDMQAEALRRGLATPFHQLVAEVSAWGMHLQVSPLDVRFPQLVRVSDPRRVRDLLAAHSAPGETQTQVPISQYTVTPIRYRPGQRHVLRYDPAPKISRASNQGVIFAKLYDGEKGERAYRVATRVADWLTTCDAGVTALRPQAYMAAESLILYPGIAGVPLSQHMKRPGVEVGEYLYQAGAALHTLHSMPAGLTNELEVHDLATEIKEITRTSEHVHTFLPATGAKIDQLLKQAQHLCQRLPQETPTFTYGDFKADHLWVTPGGMTLIDFDTCRLADPAYDLGKFLADLRWWFDTYHQPGLEQAQEQFLAGYSQNILSARMRRARVYEVLLLVKITVHRVRLFDRNWITRTECLINEAEEAMRPLLQK